MISITPPQSHMAAVSAQTGKWERIVPYLLLFLVGVVLLPYAAPRVFEASSDEFNDLYDGKLVLQGYVPYRDFFNFQGVGNFYLLALIFRIFGTSIVPARLCTLIAIALTALLLYQTGRRAGLSCWIAFISPAVLTTLVYPDWPITSHYWFAELATALALFSAVSYQRCKRLFWLLLAGMAVAAAFLFVQTYGLLEAVALGAWLFCLAFLSSAQGGQAKSVRWKTFPKAVGSGTLAFRAATLALLYFTGGIALLLFPFALYFASQHALGVAFYDTLIWPSQSYKGDPINKVWYAQQLFETHPLLLGTGARLLFLLRLISQGMLAYVPFLVLGAALLTLCRALLKKIRQPAPTVFENAGERYELILLLTLLSGLLFLVPVLIKPDVGNIGRATLPVYLLWPYLAVFCQEQWKGFRAKVATWSIALLGIILCAGALVLLSDIASFRVTIQEILGADAYYRNSHLARYIQSHQTATERIVVLPEVGISAFYTYDSATKYGLLFPAYRHYNTLTQLRDAASDIARYQPRYIYLSNAGLGPPGYDWFKDPTDPLGTFMRQHYAPYEHVDSYTVYRLISGETLVGVNR